MGDMVSTGSKYTDDDRREAAILFVIKGTLRAVERETGIPHQTLSDWQKTDWWEGLVNQAWVENEDRLRAQFCEIADKASKEVLERIEKGDEVNTKDGIQRRKMSGRDLATTGAIFYDKLRLSMNLPTAISDSRSGEKARLEELMREFHRISEMSMRRAKVINGEYKEIDDETV